MNERQIIARNIKLMREASGFTQQHVADFLGIQRSTYSNYETGDRELPLSVMEKLADLYGCDTYAFEVLKQDKVCSVIKVDNTSSIRVAESIGMRKEDTFIARYYNGDMLHYLYSVQR